MENPDISFAVHVDSKPKKIQCKNKKEAVRVCFLQTCEEYPFMCSQKGCTCREPHKQCLGVIFMQDLIQKLESRLIDVEPLIKKHDSRVNQFIIQVQKQAENFKKEYRNWALNILRFSNFTLAGYKVLMKIQTNNVKDLKGSDFYQIIKDIKKQNKKQESDLNRKVKEMQEVWNQIQQSLTNKLNKFRGSLKQEFQIKLNQKEWDKVLTSQSIVINEKVIKQTKEGTYDASGFAFCICEISSKDEKLFQSHYIQKLGRDSVSALLISARCNLWGIKIQSQSQNSTWIGIGACFKNVLKSHSYTWKYNETGHGTYLIAHNGYSWSHSHQDENYVAKSFKFVKNDSIYVQYNPKTNTLKFRKDTTNEEYCLKMLPIPEGQFLTPCVILIHLNDSVSLVNVPKQIKFS